MARYDRKVLIPYLRDVYSIELMRYQMNRQLENNQNDLEFNQEMADRWINPPRPVETSDWKQTEARNFFLFYLGGFVFCFALSGLLFGLEDKNIIPKHGFFAGLFGVLTFIDLLFAGLCACGIFNTWKPMWREDELSQNDKRMLETEYNNDLEAYRVAEEERPYYKELIVLNREKISEALNVLKEAGDVADDLYSTNIIPNQYRNNVYAAFFLYDYFSTSREDDVDMVLQTYVLETIKQRLDIIIENQERLLACQLSLLDQVNKQNEELLRLRMETADSLAAAEQIQDEQTDYLRIIDCNIRAGNFIAAMNYLSDE